MSVKYRIARLEKKVPVDTCSYKSYVVLDSPDDEPPDGGPRGRKTYIAQYDDNGVCIWRGPESWDDDEVES